MKKHKIKNQKTGFSLLETTVAVAILVMAVLGPLTLGSSSIRASSLAKNNLIAAGLAQEGIELFRNYRGSNVLKSQSWTTGLGGCFLPNGCTIDAADLAVDSCGASCPPISLDAASGLYGYAAGSPTIFTRKVTAENTATNEIKIKSSVTWSETFGSQKFELEEFMLNW